MEVDETRVFIGTARGHYVTLNDDGFWYYDDTGEPLDWDNPRPCTVCGKTYGHDEPDPCFGKLPGVTNACCGHGVSEDAYVSFENGVRIQGFDVVDNLKTGEHFETGGVDRRYDPDY